MPRGNYTKVVLPRKLRLPFLFMFAMLSVLKSAFRATDHKNTQRDPSPRLGPKFDENDQNLVSPFHQSRLAPLWSKESLLSFTDVLFALAFSFILVSYNEYQQFEKL